MGSVSLAVGVKAALSKSLELFKFAACQKDSEVKP